MLAYIQSGIHRLSVCWLLPLEVAWLMGEAAPPLPSIRRRDCAEMARGEGPILQGPSTASMNVYCFHTTVRLKNLSQKHHGTIFRVWYYSWFQASTGGLGKYSLQIRENYCNNWGGFIRLKIRTFYRRASLVAQTVKRLPTMWET